MIAIYRNVRYFAKRCNAKRCGEFNGYIALCDAPAIETYRSAG